MAKKEKRFVIKEQQFLIGGVIYIIVDTVTGVNYITTGGCDINGLTPLLDASGNVVIDKV